MTNSIYRLVAQIYASFEATYQEFLTTESFPDSPINRFAFTMSAVQEIEKDPDLQALMPVLGPFLDRLKADLALLAIEIPADLVMKMKQI